MNFTYDEVEALYRSQLELNRKREVIRCVLGMAGGLVKREVESPLLFTLHGQIEPDSEKPIKYLSQNGRDLSEVEYLVGFRSNGFFIERRFPYPNRHIKGMYRWVREDREPSNLSLQETLTLYASIPVILNKLAELYPDLREKLQPFLDSAPSV